MTGLDRARHKPQFEQLSPRNDELGRIGILQSDTETFGFVSATYTIAADHLDAESSKDLAERFRAWTQKKQVSICSCSIPADNHFWKSYLPKLDFKFVDFSLRATLNGLQTKELTRVRIKLRKATSSDREKVEEIAHRSFHHGRYHADALFPRELADRRYRDWMKRALSSEDSSDHVYVFGKSDRIMGFYHVTIEAGVANLRLAALSPELQGTGLGFELYAAILMVLKNQGVRRVVTTFSPGNIASMGIFSVLGFRFSDPEVIFHWQADSMDS